MLTLFSPPYQLFFRSPFSARLSDMCLIFAATVDFRPLVPACATLVCICVSILRPFFSPLLWSVYHSSPCPGDSFVTIDIRMPSSRLASPFLPSLCINFSSFLLSFPINDQYFVMFRLHTLSYLRDIKTK